MLNNCEFLIQELTTWVNIGTTEEERSKKQTIVWSIRMIFDDTIQACFTDNINDTLCYDKVSMLVFKLSQDKPYQLLEYLVQTVLLELKKLTSAKIHISATKKPVSQAGYKVTFTICS